MNRVHLNSDTETPHFVGSWMIKPQSICDDIVKCFEAHSERHTEGCSEKGLCLETKKSTDFSVLPRDLSLPDYLPIRQYLEILSECHEDYLRQWPFLRTVLARAELGSFNIQRYGQGGHFQEIHSERTSIGTSYRVLAWMTYLNDVEDGGSTSFIHQGFEIQPKRGLTLIWPAEWTHAHRGNIVNSGLKYVITGWMHFPADAPE